VLPTSISSPYAAQYRSGSGHSQEMGNMALGRNFASPDDPRSANEKGPRANREPFTWRFRRDLVGSSKFPPATGFRIALTSTEAKPLVASICFHFVSWILVEATHHLKMAQP
jgi:hypothetical protein